MALSTAHRELRQAREGATVAKSGCGKALTFLCLSALALAPGGRAEETEPARAALPTVEVALPSVSPQAAEVEPDYPFLEGEDMQRSLSVGDTSHGFLVRARAVKESDALAILSLIHI